jgi:ABC-2 type transport system ATP-binding protein
MVWGYFLIEVSGLVKSFGERTVIDHISFMVCKGEIAGFLGVNGSGKTTTLNMLTGFTPATEGRISVCGFDMRKDRGAAKKRIGYLPEQPPLYGDMTVDEYLSFVYKYKKTGRALKSHLDELCARVGLVEVRKRLIRNLSKGFTQRVGLAQALVGDPDVLLLDEPMSGLDPLQIMEFRNIIKVLGENKTVFLSSHILSEIEAVCERLIIIDNGKIAADGRTEKLLCAIPSCYMQIRAAPETVLSVLKGVPGVKNAETMTQKEENVWDYRVDYEDGTDAREDIFFALAGIRAPLLALAPAGSSLEDLFVKLSGKSGESHLDRKTP